MLKRGMKPSHPGALLKEMINGLNEERQPTLTKGEIADGLGLTRKTLSFLLNEKQGISIEMSIRLDEAFGTSAQFWINVKLNYELWDAERNIVRTAIRHFVNTV